MCNIILFKPGQMMSYAKLANCVYNNWHSFGLVTILGEGQMDILRVLPESGEITPEQVIDALNKDLDKHRILHLRHSTAGTVSEENTHPFDVLYQTGKDANHLVFMHNGTLYQYKSKKFVDSKEVDDDDCPSDTKKFVDQILTPFFANSKVIDIHSAFFKKMMHTIWPGTNNRGLLISNRQAPVFLGEWKTYKDGDQEFTVANTDYFETTTRGPEHVRRLLLEKKKQAQNSSVKHTSIGSTPLLQDYRDFSPKKLKGFFSLRDTPDNIMDDWEVYERDGMTQLGMLTKQEISMIADHPSVAISLMEYVFTDYASMFEELAEITEKHHRASKIIEQMKKEQRNVG